MATGLTAENLDLQDDQEELDVLDLPQLYTRPSAASLLSTLSDLKSQPSSWDSTPISGDSRSISGTSTPFRQQRNIRAEGVPAYLTKIVSSSLQWIDDEDEKEQIWQTASYELSARSGRTAQGDISRSFYIPLDTEEEEQTVMLVLREPALTADNLGFKTWASSYMLAKRLCQLKPQVDAQAVLEIGAGTGLVGMAAACVLGARVILTDLPEILPNLEHNRLTNESIIEDCGGSAKTAILDWRQPQNLSLEGQTCPAQSFSLIVAADVVYSAEQPQLVSQTIDHHLSRTPQARVVIELPVRHGFDAELSNIRQQLESIGLGILLEGEEDGFDDWANSSDGAASVVRCAWTVWHWQIDVPP